MYVVSLWKTCAFNYLQAILKRLSVSLVSDQTGKILFIFFNNKNPVEWIKGTICYSVVRDFRKKLPIFWQKMAFKKINSTQQY